MVRQNALSLNRYSKDVKRYVDVKLVVGYNLLCSCSMTKTAHALYSV